jgi:glutaredoxin 3
VSQVEIYLKIGCPYSIRSVRLLDAKGVDYEIVHVDFGGEKKQQMVQRANGRTPLPQRFLACRHVGGCDDLMALESRGELDPMLTA